MDDSLWQFVENYVTRRQQSVVLKDQTSSWNNILTGVAQGSVLGLLLLLIYINDLNYFQMKHHFSQRVNTKTTLFLCLRMI